LSRPASDARVQGACNRDRQSKLRSDLLRHFDDTNRALFAFASYNAGAANIAKIRAEATARGLDRDKWFNNVEIVVAEKIGIETTTYVRNIYKYYAAYRLIVDAQQARDKAIRNMRPGG
jgi:membrane-bound lytic murein transglycosylase MltF